MPRRQRGHRVLVEEDEEREAHFDSTADSSAGAATVMDADTNNSSASVILSSQLANQYSHSQEQSREWCMIRLLSGLSLALTAIVAVLAAHVVQVHKEQAALTSTNVASSSPSTTTGFTGDTNSTTSTSWLPLPSSDTILTKIAFGSCSRQDMPQPYWDTLATFYRPQITLLMGDNIYGDCREETCAYLKQAYVDFGNHPSVQGFAQQFPVFATLDDHDYGKSDCHSDNPYKDLAREMFAEFFGLNISALPVDGVYRSAIFGPMGSRLQVILLDTRYSRSPFVETGNPHAPYVPANETNSDWQQQMLSEAQWAWLEQELDVDADLRVIVSSIQVLNDVVVFEGWRHLPLERDRLYHLLQNKNIILFSGDRHVGGFYETESGIREVTASSWTHTIPFGAYGSNCSTSVECDEMDPRRIGPFVRVNHFGSLEIDWTARTFQVALRRTETTYGAAYFHQFDTDAGQVLLSMNYSFIEE